MDPDAIRRARLDAGLTLAEVAGPELSRQAVQRIEAGRARPSMRTLEIIASRVGSPVSALLAHRPPARPPESLAKLCQTHQYERALVVGRAILEGAPDRRQEATANHYLGLSLVRLNRPTEALDHLREARHVFDSLNDPWLVAEMMDWEACALYLLRDPRALDLVQEALGLYRVLEPRNADTEARILEHFGILLYWHHEWDRVLACFNEALAMPGVVRDFERMGRIYHGMGAAYIQLGEYERAAEVLGNARVLYKQESELTGAARIWLARLENSLGLALMYLSRFERAARVLLSSKVRAEQAGIRDEVSHILLSLGELRALQGRPDEAFDLVRQAIALGHDIGELTSVAQGHVQLAELHDAHGEHEVADGHFGQAVAAFERAGYPRRLEECLQKWQAMRAGRESA